ncbi:unnamed protein product [Ceratitis capitata]|uniref:(Mediterranean fruit fly) hypothetical protein n=1 Tax=Ceratitis capitata TaxID=7213 RepID=A0A811VEY3_CERCA|nr:unnamed protein product [Ceratitis capitata]
MNLLFNSTQSKVAPVGKSDSALHFKADIIIGVNAGPMIDEIIIHDFKLMIINSEVGYFVLSSFPTRPIRFATLSSLEKSELTARGDQIPIRAVEGGFKIDEEIDRQVFYAPIID